jgi:hypothetical protein
VAVNAPLLGAYMNDNQVSVASTSGAAFSDPNDPPESSLRNDGDDGILAGTACEDSLLKGTALADLSYARRRASEERTAALGAPNAKARRVHTEMAERYEERVRHSMGLHGQLAVATHTYPAISEGKLRYLAKLVRGDLP